MNILATAAAFGLAAAALITVHTDAGKISSVRSASGVVEMRPGSGSQCEPDGAPSECTILYVGGKPVVKDYVVSITSVFPTSGSAQLVSVDTSTGGNACCFASYILDVSSTEPILIKNFAFGKNVFWTNGGISFTSPMDDDQLGDPTSGLFRYELGSGKPRLLKRFPVYDRTPLNAKHYPSEVLSDPINRKPTLSAVGRSHFAKFRLYLGVASNDSLKFVGERYIIGSGCMPHACVDMQGFFVIDRMRRLAWCLEYDEGSIGTAYGSGEPRETRLWGDIRGSDPVVRQAIAKWLDGLHLSLQDIKDIKIMPLPDDVRSSYETRSIAISRPKIPLGSDSFGKAQVDRKTSPPLRVRALPPTELFRTVSPSVYVVDVETAEGDRLQGSAVSIGSSALLTNCHLVANARTIKLARGEKSMTADVVSENRVQDRCVLKPQYSLKNTVPVRSFASLEIGERVYSIGVPLGLELTLADGLLSGKRSEFDERFIQTTAPISPGSSGGGLFDEKGNLIGITTFMLKESENLNFAIAADEFLHKN